MKKALIAMSGGVDSSVSAWLMIENGFECAGATMKLFENTDIGVCSEKSCCSLKDATDARAVATKLGMPFFSINFTTDFNKEVIGKFIDSYRHGLTPNPCIDCNRYMKFDKFIKLADSLGYDCIATGHYARTEFDDARGRWLLKKGVDETKDQSYVLYSMTQSQLARTIFPLGDIHKTETRAIAQAQGFINAEKHDSQDICFVPDGNYPKFIEQYTGEIFKKGKILDINGNILGEHSGIIHYTIGQRRGMGISAPEPLYVCAVNAENNTVMVGSNDDLLTDTVIAKDINLISVDHIDEPLTVKAKVRYKQYAEKAIVTQIDNDTLKVKFNNPQRAVAKGQALVLYDGDTVVGGGTIAQT